MAIAYPYQIDGYSRTALAHPEKYIRDLIEQVLFTMPGERVNRPEFGTGLQQLLFAAGNDELITAQEYLVKSSLQQWLRDKILVEAVQIIAEEEKIFIMVQYIIYTSQQRKVENYIVPKA